MSNHYHDGMLTYLEFPQHCGYQFMHADVADVSADTGSCACAGPNEKRKLFI